MCDQSAPYSACKRARESFSYEHIAALRDFFGAKNARDLEKACAHLCQKKHINSINWTEFEYAFNHLFVGPMAVQAPPYASVYIEPEPQLMGRVSLEMRNLYDELSLAVPPMSGGGVLPDDHISLELDALITLLAIQDWCCTFEGSHTVEEECRMHLSFLLKHLSMWIPQFVEKACQKNTLYDESNDIHPIMIYIMAILSSNIRDLSTLYAKKSHTITT